MIQVALSQVFENVYTRLTWEVEQYGFDVVTAFGEYCGTAEHLRRRLPHVSLENISTLIGMVMDGYEVGPSFSRRPQRRGLSDGF